MVPCVDPSDQIDMLNETLSGIEDNFTRVRADIARNKIDIDENLLDVTDRINAVEASIPSYDEFYLKTGGDVTGYVYSKGSNSGFYLGAEDGSLLSKLIERNPQESLFELRGRTAFKLTGFAPGDNQAFAYVDLDTSVVNGLQLNRLSDPVQENDAVNKRYVDNQFKHPGMGLRWKYTTGSATTGKFTIKSGKFLYMSGTTSDGRRYLLLHALLIMELTLHVL